jgi:hypothetical protein
MLLPQLGAVTIGQVQTFDDPDHHWITGGGPFGPPASELPLALGGPGGALDPYLSLVATGGDGPGSRLSAQNLDEWSGNYVLTGVTHVAMDVKNFGPDDLSLRLLFVEFGAMGPVNAAVTTTPVLVGANSDWETVRFNVSTAALTTLFGSAASALSNTTELRLFHNTAPAFAPGTLPAIVATLGMDNITAEAVPEPATWTMLFGGLLLGTVAHRRCRRK